MALLLIGTVVGLVGLAVVDSYAVAQLKHSQGNISQNALLEAEDKVKQAQEAVDSALIELWAPMSISSCNV